MALTPTERERVRYHLGYLSVGPAASLSFGIPRPIQTIFLVETAMTNLLEDSFDRVRNIINIMDDIENRLSTDALDHTPAKRLGDLELRQDEPDRYEKEYYRWAMRLADILGVPLYPYSERFRNMGMMSGNSGGNIPVQ